MSRIGRDFIVKNLLHVCCTEVESALCFLLVEINNEVQSFVRLSQCPEPAENALVVKILEQGGSCGRHANCREHLYSNAIR